MSFMANETKRLHLVRALVLCVSPPLTRRPRQWPRWTVGSSWQSPSMWRWRRGKRTGRLIWPASTSRGWQACESRACSRCQGRNRWAWEGTSCRQACPSTRMLRGSMPLLNIVHPSRGGHSNSRAWRDPMAQAWAWLDQPWAWVKVWGVWCPAWWCQGVDLVLTWGGWSSSKVRGWVNTKGWIARQCQWWADRACRDSQWPTRVWLDGHSSTNIPRCGLIHHYFTVL